MNRKKKSIHLVLWKYKQRQALTSREDKLLFEWVKDSELHQEVFDELSNDDYWQNELTAFSSKDGDPAWNIIGQRLEDIEYFEGKSRAIWLRYSVAAAVVVRFNHWPEGRYTAGEQ